MGDELASRNIPYDEQWVDLRINIDSKQFGVDTQPLILLQYHGTPDFEFGEKWRNPVTAMNYRSGELQFYYRGSKERVTPKNNGKFVYTEVGKIELGSPTLDAWNNFVIHTVWDPTGNNGLLEVWHNGKHYRLDNISLSFNDEKNHTLNLGNIIGRAAETIKSG